VLNGVNKRLTLLNQGLAFDFFFYCIHMSLPCSSSGMYTATATDYVEDFNVLLDLFVRSRRLKLKLKA
jgi:hypothetical protein